jgi:hypothetical protein
MQYQLPNGKVINITIEEYLEITDLDIQYLMSLDFGEHIIDPFSGSAVQDLKKEKYYDFDFGTDTDDEVDFISDDEPFDDIIDLGSPLDI